MAQLCLLVILLGFLSPSLVMAQTIQNTASLSYVDSDSNSQTILSNTVTASVIPEPSPSEVTFYHYTPSGGDETVFSNGTQCFSGGVFVDAPLPTDSDGSTIDTLSPIDLNIATAYHISEPIFIGLTDLNRNQDPNFRESIEIEINTSNGDSERLKLRESSEDSGFFIGSIQSVGVPPAVQANDCQLSLEVDSQITADYIDADYPTDTTVANVLVDPYGTVYDSTTGVEVNNVLVRLVNAADGTPATVFDDDGVTPYPYEVVTGSTFTVGANTYTMPAGGYRFPLIPPGDYRLEVENLPASYQFPTQVSNAVLAGLTDSDGDSYSLEGGLRGEVFNVSAGPALNIDLPIDPQGTDLILTKSAQKSEALLGDFILYTLKLINNSAAPSLGTVITDNIPAGFKLKAESVKVDGLPADQANLTTRYNGFDIAVGDMTPGALVTVSYVLEVTAVAPIGKAVNTAYAKSTNGLSSNKAEAVVNIKSPFLSNQATIIGEVLDVKDCKDPLLKSEGLPNVKVYMEDGSYVVTDRDGRFHFQDVSPGTHVVRALDSSLPLGYRFQKCSRTSCTGKKQNSQFVDLQAGTLWRVVFYAKKSGSCLAKDSKGATKLLNEDRDIKIIETSNNKDINGIGKDWLSGQAQGRDWLFPSANTNLRSPGTVVAIKHLLSDTVSIKLNSKKVNKLFFERVHKDKSKGLAVSQWSSIPVEEGENLIEIKVRDSKGQIVKRETRSIFFSNYAESLELVENQSVLGADGVSPIKIAFKVLNKDGKPVRKGVKIAYSVNSPFIPLDTEKSLLKDELQTLNPQNAEMEVSNDEGLAYVTLSPTSEIGEVRVKANVGSTSQEYKTWLTPVAKEWVVVGFVEGTAGFETLKNNAESTKSTDFEAQTKFYARGKIKGEWIATIAYDSKKEKVDDEFGSVIDPDRYYTIYGDQTTQKKDSASREKLYLRIEKSKFYALFGDYEAGLIDTSLARYNRAFTGFKSEYDGKVIGFKVFGTEAESSYQRYESMASGFGNLRLNKAPVQYNSEQVRVEVRGKFNGSKIISSKVLTRYLDYNIDFVTGVINFKNLDDYQSRDFNGNPRFIIVEFETEGASAEDIIAGGRLELKLLNQKLKIGTSYISEDEQNETNTLNAFDATYKFNKQTEATVEVGKSSNGVSGEEGSAFKAELKHQSSNFDANIYTQDIESEYGLGQEVVADKGTKKHGLGLRYKFSKRWNTELQYDSALFDSGNTRDSIEGKLNLQQKSYEIGFGVRNVKEEVGLTESNSSQLIGSLKKNWFGSKYELEARIEKNIQENNLQSQDFPDRYAVQLGYKLSPKTRLVLGQELSQGQFRDLYTTKFGVESSPWAGAKIKTGVNSELSESGTRSYSNLGLTQNITLNSNWKMDVAFDVAKTLSDDTTIAPSIDNTLPNSAGGFLGNNSFSEDYKSGALGFHYKKEDWAWNIRGEARAGSQEKRYGLQSQLSHELNKGVVVSARSQYLQSYYDSESEGQSLQTDFSIAYRPLKSRWSLLNKLTIKNESIKNPNALNLLGETTFSGNEDFKSLAVVNNFNLNRLSEDRRFQWSFYYGLKFNKDQFNSDEYKSITDMVGFETRKFIGKSFDLGLHAYALNSWESDVHQYAVGPSVGVSPAKNTWISLGYNFTGFTDKDFDAAKYTNQGVFLKLRLRFDETTFGLDSKEQEDHLEVSCEDDEFIPPPAPVKVEPPKPKTIETPKEVVNDKIEIGRLQFETNKADFIGDSKEKLDHLIRILIKYPNIKKVRIEGHTDSQGSESYNIRLSGKRARQVYIYLTENGIADTRLIFRGFGEAQPIADNLTKDGRYTNRRVEFTILDKEGVR